MLMSGRGLVIETIGVVIGILDARKKKIMIKIKTRIDMSV